MLIQLFKRNIISATAIITGISVIVGSTLAVENRYAKTEELEMIKRDTQSLLIINRKQNLEDKLFELRLQQNPNAVTDALIKRYEEQLKDTKILLEELKK